LETAIYNIATTVVPAGITLLFQSTVITGFGFAVAWLVRSRGSRTVNTVLRITLAMVVLGPVATRMLPFDSFRLDILPPVSQTDILAGASSEIPPVTDFSSESAPSPVVSGTPSTASQARIVQPSNTVAALPRPVSSVHADPQEIHGGSRFKANTTTVAHSGDATAPTPRIPAHVYLGLGIFFTVCWAAGTLWFIIRTLSALYYITHLKKSAVPASSDYRAHCRMAASIVGTGTPEVLQHPRVHSPFIAGWFHPFIVLPLGDEERLLDRHAVFLHELCHLRRRDPFWNIFRAIGLMLHPVQPLMWVLSAWLEETSDYVCDDTVTTHMKSSRTYARNLFDLASMPLSERIAGIGLVSYRSPLSRRILRILDDKRPAAVLVPMQFTTCCAAVCFCMAFAAGHVAFGTKYLPILIPPPSRSVPYGAAEVPQGSRLSDPQPEIKKSVLPKRTDDEIHTPFKHVATVRQTLSEMPAPIPVEPKRIVPRPISRAARTRARLNLAMMSAPELSFTLPLQDQLEPEPATSLMIEPSSGDIITADAMPLFQAVASPVSAVSGPQLLDVTIEEDYQLFDMTDDEQKQLYEVYLGLDTGKSEPAWSPDGRWIAFTDHSRIWIVSADGGIPHKVFSVSHGAVESLGFTPDGREITFKRNIYLDKVPAGNEATEPATYNKPVPQIEAVNIFTEQHRVIINGGSKCSWSGDGRYCAYITFDDRYYISEEGKYHVVPAVFDTETEKTWYLSDDKMARYGNPTISPDGTHVLLTIKKVGTPNMLYRIPLHGGEPTPVLDPEKSSVASMNIEYPTYAPDGGFVLFTGLTVLQEQQQKQLFLLDTDNGDISPVLPDIQSTVSFGTWSPEGDRICYVEERNGNNYIYIKDFESDKPIQATDVEEIEEEPVPFAIRGNYPNPFNLSTTIEFTVDKPGSVSLAVYAITGQRLRILTSARHEPGVHSISWDGRDNDGRVVSSGVYIAELRMDGRRSAHSMTLTK
jgi:beta-lactamase regulating signal transducer with metallopeptidase domain/Tol biopolymer transport system component